MSACHPALRGIAARHGAGKTSLLHCRPGVRSCSCGAAEASAPASPCTAPLPEFPGQHVTPAPHLTSRTRQEAQWSTGGVEGLIRFWCIPPVSCFNLVPSRWDARPAGAKPGDQSVHRLRPTLFQRIKSIMARVLLLPHRYRGRSTVAWLIQR